MPTKSLLIGFIGKGNLTLFNKEEYRAYINIDELERKIKEKSYLNNNNNKKYNDYLRIAILITQDTDTEGKSSDYEEEGYNYNCKTYLGISDKYLKDHPNGKTIKSLIKFCEEKNLFLHYLFYYL